MLYYRLFGVFSTIGLAVNVLLLLALLSMLQATLTLPGIAAIALTLGMAIDSNVLINERIREELRNGASPQQAIHHGFERAWGTILDSNLTTLIVGLALLAFGSGPMRGFAVVHCLGILTSMFSSVVGVRRAGQPVVRPPARSCASVSIGQVRKPSEDCQGQGLEPAATQHDKDRRHGRSRRRGPNRSEGETWNSSVFTAPSRSCGMRWCSTSSAR